MSDLNGATMAEKRHEAAASDYVEACASYEAAAMAGDDTRRFAAEQHLQTATDAYAQTLADLVMARRASAPSFEELLRDPTMQVDPGSVVLASLMAYADAMPATAGLPVQPASEVVFHVERKTSVTVHNWWSEISGTRRDTAERLTAAR